MLSRVADNMYWLSRYLERAEHTARALNLTLNILLGQSSPEAVNSRCNRLLESLFAETIENPIDLYSLTNALAFDRKNSASITFCISHARENARQIREQISSEMWEHLNELYHQVMSNSIESIWQSQTTHRFLTDLVKGIHLFQGLTDSTMSHNEGWYFLRLGRNLERASYSAHFLDVQFRELQRSPDFPFILKDYMEWVGLLKSFTAFEFYCKTYSADLRVDKILEFLLLDEQFPHSIRYSINNAEKALKAIDKFTETKRSAPVTRLIGKLRSDLDYAQIDEIIENGLSGYLEKLRADCDKVHEAFNTVYISYEVDKAIIH
jgi:uncharacterized alpha-E superfamily protein